MPDLRLALLAALVTLLCAPAAWGASIAYIGADGNAYLTSPDGTNTRQLTTNGTADNKYKMAGQTDAGTVVVEQNDFFFWLNRDGTNKSGPWLAPKGNLGTGPLTAHVSPAGGLVTFWASNCTFACQSRFDRIVFMPEGPLSDECTINCHDGYILPRFVPGTNGAGFLETGFTTIYVQSESGLQPWLSTDGSEDIVHFDVSRQGARALLETNPDTASGPITLVLWDNKGVAPPTVPGDAGVACATPNFAAEGADPVWSPDGSQIAWATAAGIYVSPAPVPQADTTCALSPRLIVPGGSHPEWGPQDVPAPQTDGGGGGGGSVAMSVARPALGKALKKGLVVTLDCPAACSASVKALIARAKARDLGLAARKLVTVGKGSGRRSSAGKLKVRVKFTAKARRKLKKARKLRLTLRASVKSGGTTQRVTKGVTLRR